MKVMYNQDALDSMSDGIYFKRSMRFINRGLNALYTFFVTTM